MKPAYYPIVIEQGEDYSLEITWKDSEGEPIDVTNYTAAMQIRKTTENTNVLLALVSATSPTGITVGDTDGKFTLAIAHNDTSSLPPTPSDDSNLWVYDLEVTSPAMGNVIKKLLRGSVKVNAEVTR